MAHYMTGVRGSRDDALGCECAHRAGDSGDVHIGHSAYTPTGLFPRCDQLHGHAATNRARTAQAESLHPIRRRRRAPRAQHFRRALYAAQVQHPDCVASEPRWVD